MLAQRPYDVAVVGAGATGIAAAIEAASRGMRTVLVSRGLPGGALRSLARVETVAGYPVGLSGRELTERALAKAQRVGVAIETHDEVAALEDHGGAHRLERTSGSPIVTRFVVAATGAARVLPHIDGAAQLLGAGVYAAVPAEVPVTLRGRVAVVCGEAKEVVPAALRLSDICRRVVAVMHEDGGSALRGRRDVSRVAGAEIVCVAGVDRLESVVIRHRDQRVSAVAAAALFLVGPSSPRTSWLPPDVERDEEGFVVTGRRRLYESSVSRVFAVGDVRSGSPGGTAAIADAIRTIHVIHETED